MRAALLAALLLPAPAGAELHIFDAGKDPGGGIIWSADGYHYAWLDSGDEDRWLVDGSVRARGPAGSLAGPAALSADGRVLLHLTAVYDKAGNPLGVAAAINGRRAGKPYEEIASPALSRAGRNAAYVAKTPQGWVVSSQQGVGPAFQQPPVHLALSDASTLYFVEYGGKLWLYRDHRPVSGHDWAKASSSPDLSRVGGVAKPNPKKRLFSVEVDGRTFGPYTSAEAPVFSANGRHYAFQASSLNNSGASWDLLIVDGRSMPLHQCAGATLTVDDSGRAFQDLIMAGVDERTQIHMAFLNGKSVHPGGQPPHVALAAGGKHYAYPMLAPQGVSVGLDGKIAETGAPLPLVPAPAEFDGDEYHYWSTWASRLYLVCGSAAGANAPKTRCEAVARSAGWKRTSMPEPGGVAK